MKKSAQGVSLIEILVVVVLIGLVVFPLIFNSRQVGRTQGLRTSVQVLADDLQTVRSFARDAKDQKGWGVISDPSNKNIYKIVSGNKTNVEVFQEKILSPGVKIQTPFVIWFKVGSGGVQNLQKIKVTSDSGKTYEISVNETGAIDILEL